VSRQVIPMWRSRGGPVLQPSGPFLSEAPHPLVRCGPRETPAASAAVHARQPCTRMRSTRSARPSGVSFALRCATRVSLRFGAVTAPNRAGRLSLCKQPSWELQLALGIPPDLVSAVWPLLGCLVLSCEQSVCAPGPAHPVDPKPDTHPIILVRVVSARPCALGAGATAEKPGPGGPSGLPSRD